MKVGILLAVVLSLAALSVAACGPEAARLPATGTNAFRYFLFLDLSSSPSNSDRSRWTGIALKVIGRLGAGDGIEIYGIHDQTGAAAPLFAAATPTLGDDAGLDELVESTGRVVALKKTARETVEKVLASPLRSSRTDLFSAFDRYQADASGRKNIILFFSDMLHVTSDLDLERTVIPRDRIPQLLKRIAARREWRGDALSGASVFCILNSAPVGQRQPLNDRRTLRAFYARLFEGLGATLERFETDIEEE